MKALMSLVEVGASDVVETLVAMVAHLSQYQYLR